MKKAHIWMKDIPEAYDWRDHNAVTKVKNQVCMKVVIQKNGVV